MYNITPLYVILKLILNFKIKSTISYEIKTELLIINFVNNLIKLYMYLREITEALNIHLCTAILFLNM